ncbi:Hypothetical predicted protein [Mytilus galloprovincialis]|uniref:Uncharacterized protein n=1 Tax=Mytilus galloprovincialis TaxID=29158 RepID=A0A8B6H4K9_MYTGA|nr:Hypothetical predicted protein [Mytilus galloprovincialis]
MNIARLGTSRRVVEVWNSFPETIVTAKNVKTFERRLDKYCKEHPMIYDYTVDYNFTIGGSTVINSNSDSEIEPNIEEQADLLRLETLR